ncbi:MAG: hypothetical protein ACHQF2_12395, partial [Flavobacteriales bacterium]
YTGDSSYADLFIYNAESPLYSPPSYPPGFSLLLAPVYAFAGVSLEVMQYYMCVLLVATGFCVFHFSRSVRLSLAFSLLTACIVCFHSFSLQLREQIISDIPFVALVLFFFHFHANQKSWVATALIALAAVLTRSTGILLVAAWLAEIIYVLLFEKSNRERLFHQLKGVSLLLAGTLLAALFFPILSGYSSSWNDVSVFTTMHENYFVYKDLFEYYFMYLFGVEEPVFKFFSWLLVLLFLTGTYSVLKSKHRISVLFCFLYLLLILSYPYKWGGYRMIFPLVPFVWISIFSGIQFLLHYLPRQKIAGAVMAAGLGVLLVLQMDFSVRATDPAQCVESPPSVALFESVKTHVPEGKIILSSKPRALALFTKRPGIFINRDSPLKKTKKIIALHYISYVLRMNNTPHQGIDTLLNNATSAELIWKNEIYELYRLKD